MNFTESMTQLIYEFEEGNLQGAGKAWNRFIHRLNSLAQTRLKSSTRPSLCDEDLAASAIEAFFQGVEEKRFDEFGDNTDLWQDLVMVDGKSIGDLRREQFEQLADRYVPFSFLEARYAKFSDATNICDIPDPPPEFVEGFIGDVRQRLESIRDERVRAIVLHKLRGLTNQEISDEIGISDRRVEMRIQHVVETWERS